MHNTMRIAAIAALLGCSGIALADERQQLTASRKLSEEELASLEGTQQRGHRLAETIEEKRSAAQPGSWFERTQIAGLIELEAAYQRPYAGPSASDLSLATLELGLQTQVSAWVEAGITLLYEEDATPLEVDIAYLSLGNPERSPYSLSAGQVYLPFGAFETHMISDPLTLCIQR